MEIRKEILDELIKNYKNPEDLIGETVFLVHNKCSLKAARKLADKQPGFENSVTNTLPKVE